MFRSKTREIIIPQSEHARLAGTLASLWGNREFDVPPIDAFILGVTLHDRGYGSIDNDPLFEVPEERWLEIQCKGVTERTGNPALDLIVLLHSKRLALYNPTPKRHQFADELELLIEDELRKQSAPRELFEWVDERTHLLDDIAFDFSFEVPKQRTRRIRPKVGSLETTDMTYSISGSLIQVTPWPFRLNYHEGFLIGYRSFQYPTCLEPVLIPYLLTR